MSIRFLKLSIVSVFLVSTSLMAQMTSYEAALDAKNFGLLDSYRIVDAWKGASNVEGYNLNVEVVSYADGSNDIDVPEKVVLGLDYMAIKNCHYNSYLKEIQCDYDVYNYVKTIVDYEPQYFDVIFYMAVYRDVYEKASSGTFKVRKP